MTSHNKMITYIWSFSFGFFSIYNILSFLNKTSHFEIGAWNFWYFNIESIPLAFWAPYISIQVAFPFSYSNTSMCDKLLQLLISFSLWELHLVSSYSKNIKCVGRYIGTSLCMYQNHQDYWPIIHDRLDDRFTTITHRFQDFSHKDRCAYITS